MVTPYVSCALVVVAVDFQVVLRGFLRCWVRILTTGLGTVGNHMPAARITRFAQSVTWN